MAAGAIAFVLAGPVSFFEKKMSSRLAIFLTFLFAGGIFITLWYLLIPQLLESASQLARGSQNYIEGLQAVPSRLAALLKLPPQAAQKLLLEWKEMVAGITAQISGRLLPSFAGWFFSLAKGVVQVGTALVISVYLLYNRKKLARQAQACLYALLPLPAAKSCCTFFKGAAGTFSGYLRGMLTDSFLVGCLCALGMSLLGMDYAVLIGVIVAFTNMLPVFGPFIGAIPSTIILMTVDVWQAITFLVLIFCLQQFDGNIMAPRILGGSVGLSPLWVLLAIVVGGGLFGFFGMLIGVPTFAVLYRSLADGVDALARRRGNAP